MTEAETKVSQQSGTEVVRLREELSRVKGKQFRYILPMNKKMRKFLKHSTVDWNLNYPKDKDLVWKIKRPKDTSYTLTSVMPFKLTKEVEYNKDNVKRNTGATLESFLV